jgi:hypothetical protein
MENVTLTLSIPKKMKEEMKKFSGINWSEETRQFLKKKIEVMKVTKNVQKALEQNDYNKTAINELLQKLIKEGKLNLSDDFSDIHELGLQSLKDFYADEDDEPWKEIMRKNTYKKK